MGRYSMFTERGDNLVAEAMEHWKKAVHNGVLPHAAVELLDDIFNQLLHNATTEEVMDTEPRAQIRHEAKTTFKEVGYDPDLIDDSKVGW